MKTIIYIFLALLSSALAVISFGIFFASCAGHPPHAITEVIGIWVLPLPLLGLILFASLSTYLWAGVFKPDERSNIKVKKIIIRTIHLLMAFIVFGVCYMLFSFGVVYLIAKTSFNNPLVYNSVTIIAVLVSICLAFFTYKTLSKSNV